MNCLAWSNHYTHMLSKAYKTLNLIHHTFKLSYSSSIKAKLYISLICSTITYCSPVWQPHLLKDINNLEKIQRCATKYILNDYTNDYKSRLSLLNLNFLPLMYIYEIADILFLIKSLKNPTSSFNINNYIWGTFFTDPSRLAKSHKLQHSYNSNNISRHSYFNRICCLWNTLPVINLDYPIGIIKKQLKDFLFNHFTTNFDPANNCSFCFLCPCSRCQSIPRSPNFNDMPSL